MAEITVPVKLQIQNLQSLVNDLQSKLSNLKVGSSGFKAIQNTITAIREEIDKLSIQTGKPFIDASQFSKAEHSVEKLEDDIEKVSLIMSRLKFSDLELTNEQKSDIKAFEDQLTSIKDKLKVVKSTAKDEFLNSTMGQNWLKIDETAFSKSLSQITNNIRRAVADQNAELNKLEQTAVDYQHALTENNRIKEFISKNNGDPLSQASLGDMYDKIFMTTAKGQFRYTNNGRNLLADWLEQQLHLDDSVIAQIINKNVSAANVAGKLKEVLQSQMQKNQTIVDSNPNITTQVDAANAKYQELIAILRQVGVSEDAVAQAEAVLRAAFTSTTGEFNAYKEKLVQIAQGNTDVQSTTGMMKSQLESLRTTLQQTNGQFMQMQRTQQSFNQMKMAVVNFMGFNQVLNLTKNAIRNAINHIQELDSVMNKISIVTDMSTGDLWNQVDAYSKMAQTYGVSIKGAYEVSQIYYQQGLETRDVMTLTNETLKLAKISGLDYATTTDYMTTALRGFKMEMSEAATVVDVYSNLAAHTAVSQEELAVAMSKTASSMESVGASFEESSAMIATMVAVTRESATNIGSAMKSIASRYGELTKDPTKLVDEEGEAMAFNKVDAALQSVGISMRTVDGQFREFTDVIIELGEKWNQLDSTQQRYIATQFAGNRQQSRFLALVSNVDLLKSNLNYAENAEDTGTLQALKALDSIEAKTEQVRVAYQQFYTTIGAENVWKGFLDGAKNVINTLNSLPKLFGKIPVGAIAAITSIISLIKNLGIDLLNTFAQTFGQSMLQGSLQAQGQAAEGARSLIGIVLSTIKSKKGEFTAAGQEDAQAYNQGIQQGSKTLTPNQLTGNKKIYYDNFNNANAILNSTATNPLVQVQNIGAYTNIVSQLYEMGIISKQTMESMCQDTANYKIHLQELQAPIEEAKHKLLEMGDSAQESSGKFQTFIKSHKNLSQGLQSFGSALNMVAMTINTTAEGGKTWSGILQGMAAAATLASVAVKVLDSDLKSMPWMALASGVLMAINAISTLIVTPEERLEELENKAEELNNKAKESKANYRTLDSSIKKINELKEKRYESAEAAEEYQTAVDDLAEKFPELIAGFDETGNIILTTVNSERVLINARNEAAQAAYKAAQAEMDRVKAEGENAKINLQKKSISTLSSTEMSTVEEQLDQLNNIYSNIGGTGEIPNELLTISGAHQLNSWFDTIMSKYLSMSQNEQLSSPYSFLSGAFYRDSEGKRHYSLETLENYFRQHGSILENNENARNFYDTFFGAQNKNQLENQINAAVMEFNTMISKQDANPQDVLNTYTKINQLLASARSSGWFDAEVLKTFSDSVTGVSEDLNKWITANNSYTGYSNAVVSAWQQSSNANQQAWDILAKSGTAAAMVTNQIVKNIKDNYNEDYQKALNSGAENDWKKYQENMASFIGLLSPDDLKLFNTMAEDSANYSAIDILKQFKISEFLPNNEKNPIYQYIVDYYSNSFTSIQSRLNNALAKSLGKQQRYDGTYDEIISKDINEQDKFYIEYFKIISKENEQVLTETDEKYLNAILNQYDNLKNSGFSNLAAEYGLEAMNIFNQIQTLAPELQTSIWKVINENGLITLEGIQTIRDTLNNDTTFQNAGLDTFLEKIQKTIIPNIKLALQTFTSNLIDSWADSSKLISKLTSGLDLSDVETIINNSKKYENVDINFDSFITKGDKLVLGIQDANNYWNAYFEDIGNQINNSIEELTAAAFELSQNEELNFTGFTLDKKIFSEENDQEFIKNLQIILGSHFEEAFEEIKEQQDDGSFKTTGWKAIKNNDQLISLLTLALKENQDAINNYNQIVEWQYSQIKHQFDWSQGDYSLYSKDINELKELASGAVKLDKEAYDARTIKENINNAYNSLISDVLSKGFENINLDDYEGLITQNINGKRTTGIELGGSYEAFIRKYVEFAGLTIQEANDLIMQAIEKDQNLDIVSDVEQFAKASVGDTLNLTNFYNAYVKAVGKEQAQALTSRFSSMGMTFANGLGKLEKDANIPKIIQEIIKIARDKELLLEEEIAKLGDVLIEFLRALNDIINKGIEGTLSQVEANQLKEFGESQGLNLNFTNTTEGMKLTQASAIELYQAMQKIDQEAGTLASRTTFKNLMDGMIKGNEAYKDASANMARIAELSEAINRADANVSSARLQEYQAELAVAKEILMVRSTEEDSSFNFMDNKMPGGMYNPINYMENMAKAFNVIKDSFDPDKNGGHTGMIHAQDWYNIATEMGRIAQITGQEFTMAGVTLDGSMEKTSELIQHGFDNLSGVDSGELMVNLPKMGFNFESAAAGLTDAMDDGIKELAKAEIASLDAMIAVLEIMVAMEKLGDVAGEDMNLDLGDVLIGGITGDAATYTPAFEAWQDNIKSILTSTEKGYKDIQRAFNSVSANGKTLAEIATQDAKAMTEADVKILNAFMKAGSSLNWNLDAIGASMEEIIKSSGIEDLNVNIVDEQLGIDVTYLVDAGVFYQINWNNKNAKNMLENMLIHDETGIKSAKDMAAEAVRHYNENPQTIGTEEIIQALATKNIIKVNDQGQYEILLGNGKSIAYQPNGNNAQFYDELAKITLKDLNLVGGGNVVPTNADPNIFGEGATQQITLGSLKFNARMTIDKDGTHLVYGDDKHGYNYESMDEYTDALFKEYQERNSYDKSNASKNYTTKEEYLYGEYNYRVPVKTTITNEKGEEITDLSQDPQAVEKLEALASGKGLEDIVAGQDNVELTQKATLNYDIEPSADIEKTKAKVQSAAREALGFNTKNIQEIAYGIQDALSSSDAQTAIGNAISTGMEASLKGTDEIPLEAPSIKLTTKEVTVDLSGVNAEASGEVKPIEVDQITIKAKSAKVEWSNSEQGSENVLELEGKITKYDTEGAVIEPPPETQGKITGYDAQEATLDIQPETQGKITGYNADGITPNIHPEVEAKITGYNPSAKPENPQVEAKITSYKATSGAANTLKPDPIIADVTLNTNTAEQQLNAWIAEQSNKTINITTTTDSESNGINNANNKTPYDFKVNYKTNDSSQGYVVGTDNFNADLYSFYDSLVGWVGRQSQELDLSKMFPSTPEKDRAGIKSALLKYFNNNFPEYYDEANELITVGAAKAIEETTDQLITEVATKTVEDEEYQKRKWEEEHGAVQDQSFSESVDNSLENQGSFGKVELNAEIEEIDTKKVDGKESAELKGVIDESNIEVKEAEDESQLPTTEVKGEFNSEEMQAALSEQTYTASVTTETTVTPTTTPQTQEVTYTADTSELENQDLTLEGELIVNGESAEAEVAALKENAASGETMPIDANTSAGQSKLRAFVGMINSSAGKVKIDADDSLARNVLSQLKTDISNTKGTVKIDAQKSGGGEAKGSVSLAKGSGEALAGGRPTLMGELGPELVVSGGRYFIVGQAGAEMVNLDSDAIVFNHQQTASLLRNGKTSRGVPVTNENKAISWAKGNINGGPAMASAAAALAALKQLRAQWQALLSVSVKDLASQGGGGGGGGGGSDPKAFVKELEKWYNWMQQIAQLEKEITLEQAKREKYQSDMIARGREYYNSQMVTLDKLQQQIAVQKSLNDAQQEYFDQRRKELNQQSAFSALYGFGESGQLYYKKGIYKDGMTAFQWLSDLAGRDAKTGKANYTAKEQYQRLAAAGFDFAMQYDSSGNEIDREQDNWEEQAVQAFWDRIDADKEEMQSLHDTLEEGQKALLEQAQAQNEILREIEENQINVEKKVLKAVEEVHQRQIDNMKDEKAALEKSTKDLTDGLDKQLKQERDMYQDQKSADELSKLQRQLGILQRSGGSAVEIANLQNQIQEKQYDSYFNEQEKQIQAIKDASDAELERLDKQIELETELLAYQKEHGLLWAEVNEVLKNSPEDIANWLKENTKEYWGQSVTELAKTMREDLFELQKFKEFQEKVEGGMDALIAAYGVEVKEEVPEVKPVEEDNANQGKNTSTRGSGGISDEERNKLIKRAMREGQARGEKEAQEQIKKHKKAAEEAAKKATGWRPDSAAGRDVLYTDGKLTNTIRYNDNGLPAIGTAAGNAILDNMRRRAGYTEEQIAEMNKGRSAGGIVEKTGVAKIHDNEVILNASQTSFLRNEILGNKSNSLLGMLTDLQSLQRTASNTSTISNNHDASVIIENATVEMQVASIANDYDAQRAGEKALDKMLQIARKSQRQNRIGG